MSSPGIGSNRRSGGGGPQPKKNATEHDEEEQGGFLFLFLFLFFNERGRFEKKSVGAGEYGGTNKDGGSLL